MSAPRSAVVCCSLLAAACSGPRLVAEPAVLVAPSAEARVELARVAAEAAGVVSVTLAEDALTRDNVLVLEQQEPAGLGGRVATGRTLTEPIRLELRVSAGRCRLVRASDGREWELRAARCARTR